MSERRDIKLIVTDLDGTLLNSKHKLSARNEQALKRAIALGIPVILATGKTRKSAEHLIKQLDLQTMGVYVQGLLVYNSDGTLRYQESIPADMARKVMTYAETRGFSIVAYSGNRLLVKAKDLRFDHLSDYGEPAVEAVGHLVNQLETTTINKLILVGMSEQAALSLRWQLDQEWRGKLNFTLSAVRHQVEVLPAGAHKGKGVAAVARDMNISPEHIFAIGDAENDIELLQYAGWGVAVGNAHDKVKQVAKAIVGTNDQDGVAEALERFVLPPKPKPEPEEVPAPSTTDASTSKPQATSTE